MKVFETTVHHDEEHELVYIYLTNPPALASGRGVAKQTIRFKRPGLASEVRVDLDQDGKVVGVELDGFELP